MENYIGSQQNWEDNINARYEENERMNKEQVDNRVQEDDREQPYPNEPTKNDLASTAFNAVWEVMHKWDIDRGDISTSNRRNYANATGTDVMIILNALKEKGLLKETA